MFGVPVEKHGVNAELRQRGKVATLALGYGGGESALVAMGALKMGIPEEDLPEIKQKWRRANPHICQLWRDYEDAAMDVMNTGAPWSLAHGITVGREIDPATNQDFLTIQLPTGRKLFYAHPFLAPAKNFPERDSLHYYGMEQASKKWGTVDTWGGKICENLTQSMARDCLAETLIRLQQIGLTAVFRVHDEVIVEVDREEQLQDVLEIMARPLDWAPGLPLKGAGFTCTYYQKD
jgi:DNA polymerase